MAIIAGGAALSTTQPPVGAYYDKAQAATPPPSAVNIDDVVVKLTRQHQPAACVFVATARRAPRGLEQACHVFEKPLDYERITRTVAACRGDEGSRGRDTCCLKSGAPAIR